MASLKKKVLPLLFLSVLTNLSSTAGYARDVQIEYGLDDGGILFDSQISKAQTMGGTYDLYSFMRAKRERQETVSNRVYASSGDRGFGPECASDDLLGCLQHQLTSLGNGLNQGKEIPDRLVFQWEQSDPTAVVSLKLGVKYGEDQELGQVEGAADILSQGKVESAPIHWAKMKPKGFSYLARRQLGLANQSGWVIANHQERALIQKRFDVDVTSLKYFDLAFKARSAAFVSKVQVNFRVKVEDQDGMREEIWVSRQFDQSRFKEEGNFVKRFDFGSHTLSNGVLAGDKRITLTEILVFMPDTEEDVLAQEPISKFKMTWGIEQTGALELPLEFLAKDQQFFKQAIVDLKPFKRQTEGAQVEGLRLQLHELYLNRNVTYKNVRVFADFLSAKQRPAIYARALESLSATVGFPVQEVKLGAVAKDGVFNWLNVLEKHFVTPDWSKVNDREWQNGPVSLFFDRPERQKVSPGVLAPMTLDDKAVEVVWKLDKPVQFSNSLKLRVDVNVWQGGLKGDLLSKAGGKPLAFNRFVSLQGQEGEELRELRIRLRPVGVIPASFNISSLTLLDVSQFNSAQSAAQNMFHQRVFSVSPLTGKINLNQGEQQYGTDVLARYVRVSASKYNTGTFPLELKIKKKEGGNTIPLILKGRKAESYIPLTGIEDLSDVRTITCCEGAGDGPTPVQVKLDVIEVLRGTFSDYARAGLPMDLGGLGKTAEWNAYLSAVMQGETRLSSILLGRNVDPHLLEGFGGQDQGASNWEVTSLVLKRIETVSPEQVLALVNHQEKPEQVQNSTDVNEQEFRLGLKEAVALVLALILSLVVIARLKATQVLRAKFASLLLMKTERPLAWAFGYFVGAGVSYSSLLFLPTGPAFFMSLNVAPLFLALGGRYLVEFLICALNLGRIVGRKERSVQWFVALCLSLALLSFIAVMVDVTVAEVLSASTYYLLIGTVLSLWASSEARAQKGAEHA